MPERATKISKFLSLVLRHQPDKIGIALDESGWTPVGALLNACAEHGFRLTLEELREVVGASDKQRFAFSPDGELIRASQGHSVKVELGYASALPPPVLYHGTAERNLPSIKERGLLKGRRHHVHLSETIETALAVGARYGKPVALTIESERMRHDGHIFYLSANGVWLTDHVPASYIVRRD